VTEERRDPRGEAAPAPERRADGDATPGGREPRPWLERLGLAVVALVMTSMFGLVAIAAGAGGEWILAAMSAVGALMTVAVAAITVIWG
jgi:hypothetical protein